MVQEKHDNDTCDNGVDAPDSMTEPTSAAIVSPASHGKFTEKSTINNTTVTVPPHSDDIAEKTAPVVGKNSKITILNTGALLGCIVRTIPPDGRIRISSTVSEAEILHCLCLYVII